MAFSKLDPIENLTLQERVYRELKRLLMTGHFAPGESLTIKSLADSMGTSVMPIRESLQRLSADQAIVALPNKSIRVPEFDRSDLLEIQEIRFRLEGFAAEKAAVNVTDQDIEVLEEIDAKNIRALAEDDPLGLFNSNYDFHFLIYRAARSTYLLSMIEGLWLRMGPMYNQRAADWPTFKASMDEARPKHLPIIEALRRRDPAAAGKATRDDVGAAVEIFLTHSRFVSAEKASRS